MTTEDVARLEHFPNFPATIAFRLHILTARTFFEPRRYSHGGALGFRDTVFRVER